MSFRKVANSAKEVFEAPDAVGSEIVKVFGEARTGDEQGRLEILQLEFQHIPFAAIERMLPTFTFITSNFKLRRRTLLQTIKIFYELLAGDNGELIDFLSLHIITFELYTATCTVDGGGDGDGGRIEAEAQIERLGRRRHF